jgi:hypothetical protein
MAQELPKMEQPSETARTPFPSGGNGIPFGRGRISGREALETRAKKHRQLAEMLEALLAAIPEDLDQQANDILWSIAVYHHIPF